MVVGPLVVGEFDVGDRVGSVGDLVTGEVVVGEAVVGFFEVGEKVWPLVVGDTVTGDLVVGDCVGLVGLGVVGFLVGRGVGRTSRRNTKGHHQGQPKSASP